jgi:hypothetical protein
MYIPWECQEKITKFRDGCSQSCSSTQSFPFASMFKNEGCRSKFGTAQEWLQLSLKMKKAKIAK